MSKAKEESFEVQFKNVKQTIKIKSNSKSKDKIVKQKSVKGDHLIDLKASNSESRKMSNQTDSIPFA